MATNFIVQIHLGKYKGHLVGVYEYCKGFFSPPFFGYDSANQELATRQQNTATRIPEDELRHIENKTDRSGLPGRRNDMQKEVEKELRKQYEENPNKVLGDIFGKYIDMN